MVTETHPTVWTDDRIWQAYAAALGSPSDRELAIALQISEETLKRWKVEHPPFFRAIQAARLQANLINTGNTALSAHISNSLPSDLQELWEDLSATDKPSEAVRMSLATRGEHDKQRLLVHAMSVTHFDLNRCMKMLDISKSMMDRWTQEDPRFVRLWEEMTHAKKNFIESQLMNLIAAGNTKAILFANERLNRDRGYGQTLTVEGTINHQVAVVDLTKLALDRDTMERILLSVKNAGMLDTDGLLIDDPLRGKIIDSKAE